MFGQGRLRRWRLPARAPHGPAEPRSPIARALADQLFSRVAGADRVSGSLELLLDAAANYPAWLAAIEAAERVVDFENYIVRDDATGRRFADALTAAAGRGVRVRVLYDWLGCIGTPRRYWRRLREAGVEVRCFNRPRLDSPFGWLSRNHRKTIGIDGAVGFVAGLCVGDAWVGDPAQGVPAWRDTGVAVRGPAVADLHAAFGQAWAFAGGEADPPAMPAPHGREEAPEPGGMALRVIGSRPSTMGIYRLDQLVAAWAQRSLWLTDAYFVGTTSYVRALCAAARDGVDVRLLVPGSSDIPAAQALSRAGYRPLLEAGVRVFEWQGPMLHAKTAVADGRWARIGSSNLNIASWAGNWELDVAVEDEGFAGQMEAAYERDLEDATEITLDPSGVHGSTDLARQRGHGVRRRRGSPGRLAAGAVGLGNTVTAAITNHRVLGAAEAVVMAAAGAGLLVVALACLLVPLLVTIPLALVAAYVAAALLVRALRLRHGARP